MKLSKISIALLAVPLLFALNISTSAAAVQTETNQRTFSVELGATRIIYPEKSTSAQLSVSNPQGFPILIQSSVTQEDTKTAAPFVVTPPLFRLDGKQSSRLRIIRTAGNFPNDRESLFWLCVKALPPSDDGEEGSSKKVSLTINVAISTCDKLFYRPANLKGDPESDARLLRWSRNKNQLQVDNPTPYYMNLDNVTVGGKSITKLNYIPPMGKAAFTLPSNATGQVTWSVINDQGGESQLFESPLK